MNRVWAPTLRADKPRAMPDVAGKLETLPVHQALLQTSTHQAAVVRNTVERTELVGAHLVGRRKMTAQMFEALAAFWTKQALTIEPRIDFRDRMELTRINFGFSFLTNDGATRFIAAADALWQIHPAPPMIENFASQLGRRMATSKSSPDPTWTRNYFRIRKRTMILSSSFAA